ncbi:STAS/SEC14 domain-containing protein [Tsuneonella mangrovi]|uniref:STAS/SEC14 domain-containing protein n=1 Tax=Tsuneonella mangrovi TaxID=1982042 RepID=UPI0014724891|nr:STAS/SEC14 domain-containing protein [Tsuneonella mangrovi]
MIDIDTSDPDFVVLSPHGALSQSDFDTLADIVDTRINETDKVPNLVIVLDHLPHWEGLGAMARHFEFVKVHGKVVRKVAIVGDSALLSLGPEIADRFVSAKVRHFPASRLDEAKAWARSEADDPGRFELIDGLPRDVIALRAVGVITAQDYADTLVPLVEEKLKVHDHIKCLVVLDDDFIGYSGHAAWEDLKLGIRHPIAFERCALVTDIGWIAKAGRLLSPLMPFAFHAFPLAELEQAKSWVKR